MTARVPLVGPSLDPLIAEAKRRARQRRVLFVVLALALAGGGTGLVLGGLAAYRAATGARAPYEPGYLESPVGTFASLGLHPALSSVSVEPGGGAWIVGDSTAWHWNGTAWRSVPLPTVGGVELKLQSVAAVSANDAWAVGRRWAGDQQPSDGLIEHWNGARWALLKRPALPGTSLSVLSAAGSRDVWAAGQGKPVLLHWDGTAWRRQALPWSRRGTRIEKVVAVGEGRLWVVARQSEGEATRTAFWNGERWRFVPPPFGPLDPPSGFAATSWRDAWAVGSYRAGRAARSLAAHWDGHAWRVASVPSVPGYDGAELNDVSDVGAANAWAVGLTNKFGSDWVQTPVPAFFHWDGTSWHLMPGAAPYLDWTSISIAASRNGSAWAVSSCRADNIVFHWTGGSWRVVPHPRDVHWPSGVPASVRGREKLPTCATR